ncbi:MAG: copper chaperone [Allomuricauda sp.]|nr:MAG: copper chaperone [Allomuricauda sp.]
MKKIVLTLIIGLLTTMGVTAQKSMDKFMVQVDGLGCPFCAYGLEKKFKEFKGIKDVKIDIETGDFSFNYPAEKELTMDAVLAQVEKAGYTPITSKIERANGTVEDSEDQKIVLNDKDLISKEVFVAGNCEQCRARIEKAAKRVKGVGTASWNVDSKILLVNYDPNHTSMENIQKSIANAGHDTQAHQAKDQVYSKLPKCCHYERVDQ